MSIHLLRCPVCDGHDVVDLVARERLPVMQNVVWPTREDALAAPCAPFALGVCRTCGFAFNSRFDPALMVYDPRYDNDVPSAVFTDYYRSIAAALGARYDLTRAPVYDVGCGKGTFLDVLCATVAGARGVGVDPSCTPRADAASPVTLVREMFRADLVAEAPSLLVCRHVIEHIARPVEFVRAVVEGIRRDPAVPLFFEVPDLEWILENAAFWDFCYEHCNYFSRASFAYALGCGGVAVTSARTAFGGQYQWAEGAARAAGETPVPDGVGAFVERVARYADDEQRRIERARERLREAGASGPCVLWGMATKGVVFANLVDPDGALLAGGVDVNARKQGQYIPGTGHRIHAPEWLATLGDREITVLVMNANYTEEIRARCAALGVRARFEVP